MLVEICHFWLLSFGCLLTERDATGSHLILQELNTGEPPLPASPLRRQAHDWASLWTFLSPSNGGNEREIQRQSVIVTAMCLEHCEVTEESVLFVTTCKIQEIWESLIAVNINTFCLKTKNKSKCLTYLHFLIYVYPYLYYHIVKCVIFRLWIVYKSVPVIVLSS